MKTLKKSFRNLVLTICSLIWLSNVQAQSKGENIFIIHDAVGKPDSTVVIYLEVINQDYFFGFIVDLPLPVGFTYVSGPAWLNPARKVDHLIFDSILPGTNTLRLLSFAYTGAHYPGNDGIIAKFDLILPMQAGEYLLVPDYVKFGNVSGQNIITGTVDGSVIITTGGRIPGDGNCDGLVNVIDVVIFTNYILGTIPEWFCFENADLDGNLLVNVADVVSAVSIILSGNK